MRQAGDSHQDPFDDLKKSVRSHVPGSVNFFVEYFDSQWFNDPAYERGMSEALANAYRDEKSDLVIVAVYPALAVEIFSGVPIVFSYVVALLNVKNDVADNTGADINQAFAARIGIHERRSVDLLATSV